MPIRLVTSCVLLGDEAHRLATEVALGLAGAGVCEQELGAVAVRCARTRRVRAGL